MQNNKLEVDIDNKKGGVLQHINCNGISLPFMKEMLLQTIDDSSSLNDIIALLSNMDIEVIKLMTKEVINKLDPIATSKIFHESISIEQILPFDIIQHITTFVDPLEVKDVSKTFDACYQHHCKRELKKIEKQITSQIKSISELKNKNPKTFVVDSSRKKLNDNEVGYHGPFNNLMDAFHKSNCGDKILIYDGEYIFDSDFCYSLQFIGCGDNVHITCGDNGTESYSVSGLENTECCVYFKNIKFDLRLYIHIHQEGTLWIENCTFKYSDWGILTNGKLNARNCHFYDGNCDAIFGKYNHGFNKVGRLHVINCIFSGCGKDDGSACIYFKSLPTDCKITGNVFRNNYGYPFGYEDHTLPIFNITEKTQIFGKNKLENILVKKKNKKKNTVFNLFEY